MMRLYPSPEQRRFGHIFFVMKNILFVLSVAAILLVSCNPDHPQPNKVKVWIEQTPYDNGGELWTFTYRLHFDKKIESAATVGIRYRMNILDIPNVAGAGGSYIIEKSYQYNIDANEALITTTELSNHNYISTCDLEITGISDQIIGNYSFTIDNSMQRRCEGK